jgi:heptose-I-phosphate ethanolaminephosphotransferase
MKQFNILIKTLKEIYPTHILLLVFTPIVFGLFIDFDLFDSRIIAINLVWIPIFTMPYILLKKQFIYQFIAILYFFFGFIEITHWIILRGPLTTTSLLVMSNTNLQESLEFFDLKATMELLILIPYISLFIIAIKYKSTHYQSRTKLYIVFFIYAIALSFILETASKGRLIRKGIPQIAKVTFSFLNEINLYKEIAKNNHPKKVDAKSLNPNEKQTVIIVIGESCNRNHMSLYGATRRTNPQLEKRKDITLFNNVVSPYSNTIQSVLTILSESNLDNKKPFNESIDIIDIFHSSGFKTYWISNQSPVGIWENLVTVLAKKSDQFSFVNRTSNSSFEATLNTSYDAKVLAPFETALNENTNKKFIIIHLFGNHSSYAKRYPSAFNVFNGKTDKEETIAEYDNSILYNDYILDSLIKTVEKRTNELISFIYLSDHGENVYDELGKVGHDYSNELPKANIEIPFFVWTSKKYNDIYSEKINMLEANTNLPFVSDNLFHSIMDLNYIESSHFKKEKSIFNKDYNTNRKRILEDGRDYDLKY